MRTKVAKILTVIIITFTALFLILFLIKLKFNSTKSFGIIILFLWLLFGYFSTSYQFKLLYIIRKNKKEFHNLVSSIISDISESITHAGSIQAIPRPHIIDLNKLTKYPELNIYKNKIRFTQFTGLLYWLLLVVGLTFILM